MKARASPDKASAPCAPPARGVAGRQDHPIRVELQRGDLGSGEIAVIAFAWIIGRGQKQARLGIALHLPRQRAVRRKVHDAVLGELARLAQPLHLALRGACPEPDLAQIGANVAGNVAELVRGLRQRRLHAKKFNIRNPAARLHWGHPAPQANK